MIEVRYCREVPYPQAAVLSQYFDLEHLEHVHPQSLGRARMHSKHGRTIVWELEWPRVFGLHFHSTFTQEYLPPWGIRSVIRRGLLRGTESTVQLDATARGTLVVEHHRVALPNCLRGWVQRAWVRRLDRIWDEDLGVKLCRGGWPGVPEVDVLPKGDAV